MLNLKDMIKKRNKLIIEYDNELRLAVDDFNYSINDIEKIKNERDTLIGELITLQMFHQNKK